MMSLSVCPIEIYRSIDFLERDLDFYLRWDCSTTKMMKIQIGVLACLIALSVIEFGLASANTVPAFLWSPHLQLSLSLSLYLYIIISLCKLWRWHILKSLLRIQFDKSLWGLGTGFDLMCVGTGLIGWFWFSKSGVLMVKWMRLWIIRWCLRRIL